jgi:regulator of RNase E activity RraA
MFARRLAQVLGAKLAQRAGRAGWAGLVVEGAAQRQACRSYAADSRCGGLERAARAGRPEAARVRAR